MIALVMLVEAGALQNGNGLLQACTSTPTLELACIEYVTGVADGALITQAPSSRRTICIPPGVQLGQMKDVVVNDLRAHPEVRQNASGLLVLEALQRAFPCPASKR